MRSGGRGVLITDLGMCLFVISAHTLPDFPPGFRSDDQVVSRSTDAIYRSFPGHSPFCGL